MTEAKSKSKSKAAARPSVDGDVLLDVKGLKLSLGGTLILEGLTFQVVDRVRAGTTTGQIASLLGPSGVGKTRLLRLIAGLDEPDAGSIRGRDGEVLAAGSVGVVFQDYPLLRHRTVASNLELAGAIGGLASSAAATRTKELLETFGLQDRSSFYPAQLSGGQRQRVAIAQQLVVPRQLLLMDEPFSGLDPAALEEVMKLLITVANLDELNTIVIVTHDIRAAMAVSDTMFMLGRERKGDQPVPGARIQATYDMVALGLAWQPDIQLMPDFATLERDIKSKFKTL